MKSGSPLTRRACAVVAATGVAVAGLAAPASAARPGGTSTTPVTTTSTAPAPPADWAFDPAAAKLPEVTRAIRADVAHRAGYTGKGVGVALIDTGVVPVPGLIAGNVVNGPDLSLESQVPGLLHKDTYGHGTHLAGIIAGRDAATGFRGIAPDAKLTSLKVAAANGAVDVSQMLAAIDWVVEHRNDDPAHPIKVLNLSYGTDSTLRREQNPLTAAVENAWKAGIVVVVAAGNTGGEITSPAIDFNPVVVGATDTVGTTAPADDRLSAFSSVTGMTNRRLDVLAPGRSLVSLRNPGSFVDSRNPSARVGELHFRGSGTSQAAAVVSGAAALLVQRYPAATPADIKMTLMTRGLRLKNVRETGAKALDVGLAVTDPLVTSSPYYFAAEGNGSLEAARGSFHVALDTDTIPLTGENDLFGPFDTAAWAAASRAGTAWQGGDWMGRPWTGDGWGVPADGQGNWTGRAWSGRAWSGRAWSDISWSGATWTGRAWSSATFNSAVWSGSTWQSGPWLSGTGATHWQP
ncbi:S8 family serine peptidase [Spirilliplanes yamanashiensis]|nr:S8 family serine peptidase [Spirilliplanes yamanashiensis]MDP9817299.1 serine protease AprX [Spirilliplanes yamanashiensis]